MFLLASIANAVRHTHPGLAPLEQPQFPDFGTAQGGKLLEYAAAFDRALGTHAWFAGDRFTIADITAFCGIEFAKLIKFRPAEAGFAHLADWRERVAARPSAQLGPA
jgi:glutathione S-transferase